MNTMGGKKELLGGTTAGTKSLTGGHQGIIITAQVERLLQLPSIHTLRVDTAGWKILEKLAKKKSPKKEVTIQGTPVLINEQRDIVLITLKSGLQFQLFTHKAALREMGDRYRLPTEAEILQDRGVPFPETSFHNDIVFSERSASIERHASCWIDGEVKMKGVAKCCYHPGSSNAMICGIAENCFLSVYCIEK